MLRSWGRFGKKKNMQFGILFEWDRVILIRKIESIVFKMTTLIFWEKTIHWKIEHWNGISKLNKTCWSQYSNDQTMIRKKLVGICMNWFKISNPRNPKLPFTLIWIRARSKDKEFTHIKLEIDQFSCSSSHDQISSWFAEQQNSKT